LTLNQIDHVLVNKRKKKFIQDVRTLRGPKCDSDHFLVKVIIKQKLLTTRNKFTEKLRWNTSKLKNPKILGAYSKRLNEETRSVEQDWQNIKNIMLETAKDTIQLQTGITRNEWRDDECKEAIKEKNIARGKCLQRRTRATQDEYEKKRNIATKICRNKKKQWLNNKIKEIEEILLRKKLRAD